MVTLNQIKKLRKDSGAGIMDCRKALLEAGGDEKKASKLLQNLAQAKAMSKKEASALQGQIFSYVHSHGRIGVLLELNCETDFVAKNEEFKTLGKEICLQIASMNPANNQDLLQQEYIRDSKLTIDKLIKSTIGKIGENITVKKFSRYSF